MTIHQNFAENATNILRQDPDVIGLAAAGSWIVGEIDEYSDVDLVLVTKEKIGGNKEKMMAYARRLGSFLSGFTGDHVGEPRLLICLYDNPLLHVDLKFVTLQEFAERIETPVILLDTDHQLKKVIQSSEAKFPQPDYQWIEDRFWTWVHYALTKIGRGEYFEALDFFGFMRMVVIGPLLHISYGKLPRGVRRIESTADAADFKLLQETIASNNPQSLLQALNSTITLYRSLRTRLFRSEIQLQTATEQRVLQYLKEIERLRG